MDKVNNHLVIMAGGVGSRFWPMSTSDKPKQFIDVLGTGQSLLQLTYDRFDGVCPPENVWVVTNKKYFDIVHEQLPNVPVENILLEPCRRNTAPCIAYVSWRIKSINPKANVVVTPSDHIVTNRKEFNRIINSCLDFTSDTDAIVTLGITPTCPETGYGYIQADLSSCSLRNKEIYRIDSFKEKPDLDTAKKYISQKNYFWNAGIFIWNVSTIVNAYRVYCPQIGKVFENLLKVYGTPAEREMIDKYYPECDNISVDYAIMEHASGIYVYPASFGWSDLGTWGALYEQVGKDTLHNAVVRGDAKMIESSGCIVHLPEGKRIVVQGLQDCIIAEENGVLLICRKSDEQRIKDFAG